MVALNAYANGGFERLKKMVALNAKLKKKNDGFERQTEITTLNA